MNVPGGVAVEPGSIVGSATKERRYEVVRVTPSSLENRQSALRVRIGSFRGTRWSGYKFLLELLHRRRRDEVDLGRLWWVSGILQRRVYAVRLR
jgi:hypothetical protein